MKLAFLLFTIIAVELSSALPARADDAWLVRRLATIVSVQPVRDGISDVLLELAPKQPNRKTPAERCHLAVPHDSIRRQLPSRRLVSADITELRAGQQVLVSGNNHSISSNYASELIVLRTDSK